MKILNYLPLGIVFFCQLAVVSTICQNPPKVKAPPKIPSKIEDGFVIEFNPPFNQIGIDSDEKVFFDREVTRVAFGSQTKFLDQNGKAITSGQIHNGVEVEIKLEPTTTIDTL